MRTREKKIWQGTGVSPGQARGEVYVLRSHTTPQPEEQTAAIDVEHELRRLQQAIELTEQNLTEYEQKVGAEQGAEMAQIFTAHKLLLSDPAFAGEAQKRLQAGNLRAEEALQNVAEEAMQMLRNLEDTYFQERAVDVQDVLNQLLKNLRDPQGTASASFPEEGKWVVLAEELTPAQTISLPKERVLGFIVRKGGKTSHAAILARTYGIPAVTGVEKAWDDLADQKWVELNGEEGWIREVPEGSGSYSDAKPDNLEVEDLGNKGLLPEMILAANVGSPEDLPYVQKFKAQGVGLYRTEFLFMGDALPFEEEQAEAYRSVIAGCAPHLTVIRTLDIGGDKKAPALQLPEEQNPFLGVRALRLCLQKPELFRAQLRAIWRAATAGPTAVMFPMIATLEELRQAKEILAEARIEVEKAGQQAGALQVGMMIEIPSAAWIAGRLAQEVDFFSIGSNDLTQYMLAVDRENSALAKLYQPYHPAVLGMIARVSEAAKKAGIWVGVCGEAGGDPLLAPFWAALGIKELSMSPGSLPKARRALAKIKWEAGEQEKLVEKVLACATVSEVKEILMEILKGC